MNLGIVGPRDLNVPPSLIHGAVVELGLEPTKIITGDATGIDSCARAYALDMDIPCDAKEAEWDWWESKGNRKAAGPVRNQEIVDDSDVILAIRDRVTSGTSDTLSKANADEVPTYICEVRRETGE